MWPTFVIKKLNPKKPNLVTLVQMRKSFNSNFSDPALFHYSKVK
jgi:hypothetical protein